MIFACTSRGISTQDGPGLPSWLDQIAFSMWYLMDSGSFIVDTMTAGGKIQTPVLQRLFWCLFLGLIGIALLLGGGLASLQALSLATGFPFCIILLLICLSLYKALSKEALVDSKL